MTLAVECDVTQQIKKKKNTGLWIVVLVLGPVFESTDSTFIAFPTFDSGGCGSISHLDNLWPFPVNDHLSVTCIIFSYTAPFMSLLVCWVLRLFFSMAYFVPRALPGFFLLESRFKDYFIFTAPAYQPHQNDFFNCFFNHISHY